MGLLDWAMPIVQGVTGYLNYQSQQAANEQNLALQREEWAREDSAYQRKVADLKAAGLNPALALGGGSPSSLAVKVGAPQVDAPDMTAPIRMNLARQQTGMAEQDIRYRAAEADAMEAEARSRIAKAKFDEKYWDSNWMRGGDLGRAELEARSKKALLPDLELRSKDISNELSQFGLDMMKQFGEPGSFAQLIRGALGGSGGLLDLIRAIR